MGQRGPQPTPTAILKLRNSRRAEHRPDDNSPIPSEKPPMPKHLTGYARTKYYELAELLHTIGLVTKLDGNALARYCQNLKRWQELEAWYNDPSHSDIIEITDKNGDITGYRPHPYFKMRLQIMRELRADEREFGLTPASRARVTPSDPAEQSTDSGLSRFLRRSDG